MPNLKTGKNDLLTVDPQLASEWHPTKNGSLIPSQVTAGTNKKVWWLGKCGHEWEATVASRHKGVGCPYCAGKRVIVGVNDLATVNPELAAEWHPTKNGNLLPAQVKVKSNKKVWWLGKCGHEWEATVSSRSNERGCPYCSGNRVLKGFNDLATVNPELAAEWHPMKNGNLLPTQVTTGSNKKVWWLGKCGHEWEAAVSSRSNERGCPYCAKVKVLAGFNDLSTRRPDCLSWWDYQKNSACNISPTDLMPGSKLKVWWKCPNGHHWDQAVNVFLRDELSCPVCSGKRCQEGVNDLATVNPELATEWHPTKNGDLQPTHVMPYSNKKVWWKCAEGHEWEATVCSRTNGNGCPYCSNKKVLVGYNDLATTRPDIASEWHPVKNEDLLPTQFTYGSEKKVWWLCSKCGNEWETTINNRTNGYFSTGCPKCSGEHATSFPEQALFYYAQRLVDKDAQSRCKVDMSGSLEEVDVWMPSLKCGIEYDGEYYHARREDKDREKDSAAKAAGIRLIRLIECDRNAVDGDRIYLNAHHHQKRNIAQAIMHVLSELTGRSIDVDLEGDTAKIMGNYKMLEEQNSLKAMFPEIAAEWDYRRNGDLLPENISYGSTREVWWVCPSCGESYKKSLNTRTSPRTRGLQHCPYCPTRRGLASRKRVICVESGKVYSSVTKAAEAVNRSTGAISLACKSGSVSAGCHWRYLD